MPQIRRSGPPPRKAASTSNTTVAPDYTAGADRFGRAWSRQFFHDCGCSRPCRCEFHQNPTPKRVEAYAEAVEHLAAAGLLAGALTPELRQLWRRGGDDRRLSETIIRRWAA